MKVLTICSAGTVRSVSLAHVLKSCYGVDAIPTGHDLNSQETLDMLSDWADLIVVMQPHFAADLPARNAKKVVIVDVGPDVWGNPLDVGLLRKTHAIAKELHAKGLLKEPGVKWVDRRAIR